MRKPEDARTALLDLAEALFGPCAAEDIERRMAEASNRRLLAAMAHLHRPVDETSLV